MSQSPPSDSKDPLFYYWQRPVAELASVQNCAIDADRAFRHRVFSLLAMALIYDAWNGNKNGQWGDYPYRKGQQLMPGLYDGGRYLGHNIASLAVDGRGEIMDFEFNHNNLFNSSAEHAEARLVRRIFSLNQIFDHWQTRDDVQDVPSVSTMSAVTIYTTLESCAQCSGIMTLANLNSVVYLQSDPGQYRIGNILFNLSNPQSISHPSANPVPAAKYGAPEPIGADQFNFGYKGALEAGYQKFAAAMSAPNAYFWRSQDGEQRDNSVSITSYLCTDEARGIYKAGADELMVLTATNGDYRPESGAMTNAAVLELARHFRAYVRGAGHRGTPHK
jgi:tRNA(Arg) A34 adenosine deaminase TadA